MKTHPDLTLTILIQKLRHQTVAKQNLKIRTTCGCSAEGCNDQLSLTLFDRTPVLLTYMTPPPVARISPKLRVPGPSCPLLCRHVSRRGQSLQSGPAGGGGGGGHMDLLHRTSSEVNGTIRSQLHQVCASLLCGLRVKVTF